jgi:hypothetical protein
VVRVANTAGIELGLRRAGSWPVHPALESVLPGGLPGGGTVTVAGSVSLLLAVLGAASRQGAWCALAGLPPVGAEAAAEYGLELSRTPVVAAPRHSWAALLAALVDAVDVVAARAPARLAPGDVQRLAARIRTRGTTLVVYRDAGSAAGWPGADVQLEAHASAWLRAPGARGRLTARRLTVTATGRGAHGRPRTAVLWLPAAGGGLTDGHTSGAHLSAIDDAASADGGRLPRAG